MPSVDCTNAKTTLPVLLLALEELGWTPVYEPDAPCSVYWSGLPYPVGLHTLKTGKVNRFPGLQDITKKVSITRSLNTLHRLFPKDYDFYPVSWFLPGQLKEFQADHELITRKRAEQPWYIVKPDGGAQGDGIYLISGPEQLQNLGDRQLIQEYVPDPYLFGDDLKFDLRIYVVIRSLNPLSIWICKEGLVRFAAVEYRPPSNGNYAKSHMHLTNYSLNKSHPNFVVHSEYSDLFTGNKRLMSLLFAELKSRGVNVTTIWDEICNIAVRTIIAIVPDVLIRLDQTVRGRRSKVEFFQILGLDILLTSTLQPVLLEVNASPSLNIESNCDVDKRIKLPLVRDTLRLVAGDGSANPDTLCLKEIFPAGLGPTVGQTIMLHRAAYLYLHFVDARRSTNIALAGCKQMVKKCALLPCDLQINEIDAIFNRVARYWTGYSAAGISFNGFVDILLILARFRYPSLENADALRQLLHHCEYMLTNHGVSKMRLRPDRESVRTAAERGRIEDALDVYLLPGSGRRRGHHSR